MKKLSIFIAHRNRAILAYKAINSYVEYLKNCDFEYEILFCDDFTPECDLNLLKCLPQIKFINVKEPHEGLNGISAYNTIRQYATGDVFLISGADIVPTNNLFINKFKEIIPNKYFVFSCYALCPKDTLRFLLTSFSKINEIEFDKASNIWYQHSIERNRCLNFYSMITKEDWDKINGFSWSMKDKTAYDDDDFLDKIRKAGIEVITDDNVTSVHCNHYCVTFDGQQRKVW